LRVTLVAGCAGAERQTVAVRGLDLSQERRVTVDGVELVLPTTKDAVSEGELTVCADRAGGVVRLTLMLNRERRFDIR
jgi:ABC-type sugar transport system ATPase subunit